MQAVQRRQVPAAREPAHDALSLIVSDSCTIVSDTKAESSNTWVSPVGPTSTAMVRRILVMVNLTLTRWRSTATARQVQALGMFRNDHLAAAMAQHVAASPTTRHCFVLGLAHLLDQQATCAGCSPLSLALSNPIQRFPPVDGWKRETIFKSQSSCTIPGTTSCSY